MAHLKACREEIVNIEGVFSNGAGGLHSHLPFALLRLRAQGELQAYRPLTALSLIYVFIE